MQTVKKSYSEINSFVQVANALLRKKKEGELLLDDKSHLRYALNRILPKCVALLTDYNEQVQDLEADHCSVDEKGNMLKEQDKQNGQYVYIYTPKNQKELNQKVRELFRKTPVDAPQYLAREIPDCVEMDARMILDGFVLEYKDEEPAFEVVEPPEKEGNALATN